MTTAQAVLALVISDPAAREWPFGKCERGIGHHRDEPYCDGRAVVIYHSYAYCGPCAKKAAAALEDAA